MLLLWRKLWLLINAYFSPRMTALGSYEHRYRVLPFDLDENLHMNNGRYFNYLELARWNAMVRSGFLRYCVKHRLVVPVTNQYILYRRSLRLLDRFRLTTRTVYWTDNVMCFEHVFYRGKEIAAIALVEIRIVSRDRHHTFSRAVAALGVDVGIPRAKSAVDEVALYRELSDRLIKRVKDEVGQ